MASNRHIKQQNRTDVRNTAVAIGDIALKPVTKPPYLDLALRQVPMYITAGDPKKQLRQVPVVRAPLGDINTVQKLLDQIRAISPMVDQLEDHYGLKIEDYDTILFSYTDHLRKRCIMKLSNYHNHTGDIAIWKAKVQADEIPPDPPCDCTSDGRACNGRPHGPEIHVIMKLDKMPAWVETLQRVNYTNKAVMAGLDEEIRQFSIEKEQLKSMLAEKDAQIAQKDVKIAELADEVEAWKLNKGLNAGQTESRTTRSRGQKRRGDRASTDI